MKVADLFAGAGGFSTGAALAGADVVYAANHWRFAVETHSRQHPGAVHACQDLRQADWRDLPAFEVLLAAPCCQGHSMAAQPKRAGVTAHHDALRATAWAVVDCIESTRPRAAVVENVPQFLRWELYPVWLMALQRLGYHVRAHTIDARSFGVAQRRKRVFITITREHFELNVPKAEPVPFDPCIDWTAGKWRAIHSARPGARARLELARDRHGGRALSQHVTGHKGIDPRTASIRTVTCQDQWCVVQGDAYRPLTIRETEWAMGFETPMVWPEGTRRKDAITALGNAVCPPVAQNIVAQLAAVV